MARKEKKHDQNILYENIFFFSQNTKKEKDQSNRKKIKGR